jgi:hypothetical protein
MIFEEIAMIQVRSDLPTSLIEKRRLRLHGPMVGSFRLCGLQPRACIESAVEWLCRFCGSAEH